MPDLGGLYTEAAMGLSSSPDRNPVIVIPGILGSRLEGPNGEVVWGEFGDGGVDPTTPEGWALLALPADGSDDGVRASRVIDRFRVSLFGLSFEQQAYESLLLTLGTGGYLDRDLSMGDIDYGRQHFTCFQFAYDWRRELSESAVKLHEFLLRTRDEVRAERVRLFGEQAVAAAGPIKFDVVAHSMGGLVLRYYLRFGPTLLDELPDDAEPTWAGAALVDKAIIVGTPNLGSASALETLINGQRFSRLLPLYDAELLQTMPALWQLLPHAWSQLLDGPWDGGGFEGPLRLAPFNLLDNPSKIRVASKFHRLMDRPSQPPAGLRLYLFAADAIETNAWVDVSDTTSPSLRFAKRPGDGTVTRASALGDLDPGPRLDTPIAWDRVQFLHTDHLGMTRDPSFTDNLLFLLLIQP